MTKIKTSFVIAVSLLILSMVFVGSAAAQTATRTVTSDCINVGEIVTITIDPPAAGVVIETLCDGWTYVSTSLDDDQDDVLSGNRVAFTLIDGSSFTYSIQAPNSPSVCCTISGIYRDMDQADHSIEDDTVCTCSDTPVQGTATRTVTSDCINMGEIVTITIDPPAVGVVIETLCDGWTYVGTSLDDDQDDVLSGNRVAFTLIDGSSFTYSIQAPDSPGVCCTISGIYRDMDQIDHSIGDDTICVCGPIGPGIPLLEGWNLISVPGVLDNDSVEYVLEGVEGVEAIIWYDASTQNWVVPTAITPLTAFAVNVNDSGQLIKNLEYMPSVSPSIQMYEGWNLVGLTGMTPKSAEDTFSVGGIDNNYSKVWGPWDGATFEQYGYNKNVDDPIGSEIGKDVYTENYLMEPFDGHWIKMTDDAMLEAIG